MAPENERLAIDICAGNPRYWQLGGRPTLLLGGSVEDNLFQIPDLAAHLDTLAGAGGNYVRCTMSSRDEGNLWPFARVEGLYDLDVPDREYWLRFATFLEETRRGGVVVQVELWATFDYYRENWARNPFNPRNNRNYTARQSGLPLHVGTHPSKAENEFFRSVPAALDLPVVLAFQQRFVDELLAYSLQYDHVLYCMDNETSVGPEWGAYWSDYVRDAAGRAGKRVHTTEMWDPWDLGHPMHAATVDHPQTYGFVEVSQNNHESGRVHYDRLLGVRERTAGRPRPLNNVKVYGADGGRFGDARDGVERFWRNVFAGCAATRFHRPPAGIGLSRTAQRVIRAAREVTDAIEVTRCEPRPDLLGGHGENGAYCLAEPGRCYAVYFPDGGAASLDVGPDAGTLELRWHDVAAGGAWVEASCLVGEGAAALCCPGKGHWVAVLDLSEA